MKIQITEYEARMIGALCEEYGIKLAMKECPIPECERWHAIATGLRKADIIEVFK